MAEVRSAPAEFTPKTTNTNQAESFFSRVQCAYVGIHHRFSLKYFDWYVAEIA